MTRLQEAEQLIAQLTPSEKAHLLGRFVRELGDAFPGIERTPGIVGGEARMVRTRIPVWLVVHAKRQGLTDAQLLEAYPSLKASDLTSAWTYAQVHPDEIEAQILENEAA